MVALFQVWVEGLGLLVAISDFVDRGLWGAQLVQGRQSKPSRFLPFYPPQPDPTASIHPSIQPPFSAAPAACQWPATAHAPHPPSPHCMWMIGLVISVDEGCDVVWGEMGVYFEGTEPVKQQHSASNARHSTAQHSTAQHSTAQHSTAQHSTAQHSTSGSKTCILACSA